MSSYRTEVDDIFNFIKADLDTAMEEIDIVMESGLPQNILYQLNDVKDTLTELREQL